MRSVVNSAGVITRLGIRRQPDRTTTTADVQDPEKLARAVQALEKATATASTAKSVDFQDVAVSPAGALVSLPHGFGTRVRWWLVDWESSGTSAPVLKRDATSTNDTLVLASYVAGTVTIRIEAG